MKGVRAAGRTVRTLRNPDCARGRTAGTSELRLVQGGVAGAVDQKVQVPAISVIIACRNGAATLGETLQGLASQSWDRPWEIVLADNGSTDATRAVFESFSAAHPWLAMRAVDASAERGKPFALNIGIAAAKAPALAFCDADDVPGEGWLAAMGVALETQVMVASRVDYQRLNRGWVQDSRGTHQTRQLEELTFLPGHVHVGGGTMGFQRQLVQEIGLSSGRARTCITASGTKPIACPAV